MTITVFPVFLLGGGGAGGGGLSVTHQEDRNPKKEKHKYTADSTLGVACQ